MFESIEDWESMLRDGKEVMVIGGLKLEKGNHQ